MNAQYDARNRYLVQFRMPHLDYFTTDCAYRDGDLENAYRYLQLIVQNTRSAAEGRIFDQQFQTWTIHLSKRDLERTQQ